MRLPIPGLFHLPPQPDDPSGLVALGGRVSADTLITALHHGAFPWTGKPPVPWCSPDPRAVFDPAAVRVPRSLRKTLRNSGLRVTYDTALADVIVACAATPRHGRHGTWITRNLVRAWITLHQAGLYHSVEVWRGDTLVGGLLGVALGDAFFGDSMFHRERDASKVGFVTLARDLSAAGYRLIDGQAPTPHLERLGARTVPRAEYLALLDDLLASSRPTGPWTDGVR